MNSEEKRRQLCVAITYFVLGVKTEEIEEERKKISIWVWQVDIEKMSRLYVVMTTSSW